MFGYNVEEHKEIHRDILGTKLEKILYFIYFFVLGVFGKAQKHFF